MSRRSPHALIGVPEGRFGRITHHLRDELAYARRPRGVRPTPVLIGGSGGSGTRVIVDILAAAGYFTGSRLNRSLDSIPLTNFIRRWAPAWLARGDRPLPGWQQRWMRHDLDVALFRHAEQMAPDAARWAAKDPRTILLLPFFAGRWPDLRFIHLVRDGRDMAFSANQNQLDAYGAYLVPDHAAAPRPVQAMALWQTVNVRAADFAARALGSRYLCLTYEALCADPEPQVRRLLHHVGADPGVTAAAVACVRRPASIGRWRDQEPALVAAVSAVGAAGLRRFGYVTR